MDTYLPNSTAADQGPCKTAKSHDSERAALKGIGPIAGLFVPNQG